MSEQPTPSAHCPCSIIGTGSYLPEKILSNADLEKLVDTSDEWIISRTGIKQRRIAGADETTSDLATGAAKNALENAGIAPDDIDLIIVATVTSDMFFPATACFVQKKLGAKNALCFDISAACSGFLYALQIARHFLTHGTRKHALVIGAEKLSTLINWEDRNTCVLFGDGAGAAVVTRPPDGSQNVHGRVLSTVMGSDGNQTDILSVPGGGSACPVTPENASSRLNAIRMDGREVYKNAVTAMFKASKQAVEKAGLTTDDISMVIAHQANMRIIDAITDRLKIPRERSFINLDKYGNTSAASIPIALDEANRTGAIKHGDNILLVAFGAGLTWASSVINW